MTFRELQYLVELARLGNFHRAAEVCGVRQPTLSTQIRKLEETLGVTLVERTSRQAVLTEVGEEIVAQARLIMSRMQGIEDIAARHRQAGAGRLRLGVFPTLGPYLLPALVPLITERFPKIRLQLVEEKSEPLLDLLLAGQVDAALLALPVLDATLQVTPLFDEPFLLAVPQNHAYATRDTVTSDELSGQTLMLLEDGHCLRHQAMTLCQNWGAQEKSGFQATSLETLRQMVASGAGMTLMPLLATCGMWGKQGNLRFIPFSGASTPTRTIGIVWRRSTLRGPILRQIGRLASQAMLEITGQPAASLPAQQSPTDLPSGG